MSDTPRTDAEEYESQDEPITKLGSVDAEFARTLERELNSANTIIRQQQLLDEENLRLQDRIKRLEESENRMLNWLTEDCPESVKKQLSNAWMKSKEAKP